VSRDWDEVWEWDVGAEAAEYEDEGVCGFVEGDCGMTMTA
jgi:hypothetical protein